MQLAFILFDMVSNKRGIRNNNPFNIKKSNHPWLGKCQGKDEVFETFENMYFGIRAGLKLLINYVERGFDTPQKIISRFAPSSENNVDNYVDFICRNSRNQYFVANNKRITRLSTLCHLASRMAKYECNLGYAEMSNFHLLPADLIRLCSLYNLNKHGVLQD